MPFFSPGDDPGSSFPELLRRIGMSPDIAASGSVVGASFAIPHATTCVALKYEGGVVMAGDRRATSGNIISHRSMEKVVQADRHSAVAIAGAAGPAMEMVKMFQLQLEHYEKVEGSSLSLEGKANQLSAMVRSNLPAAMQGMVVVPIFAGYDVRREVGRLWDFDATGGRFRDGLSRDDAIQLACRSLWEAADADSATGGPDALRGIYPVVAAIDVDGWDRVDDADLAVRFEAIVNEVSSR
jgi:proteasome beta subunit